MAHGGFLLWSLTRRAGLAARSHATGWSLTGVESEVTMSDVYVQRGYGSRNVGFGAKPGLVVVDFQRGFTDGAFPMGGAPMVDDAVRNTVPLIEAAKRAGLPVIACVNGYDTPRAAPHWKIAPVFDLLRGSPSVELDPRIAATAPDVVLMKSAPSIFFATPAAAIFSKERVDTVIVTGCITSGCIRASVIDAFSLGFRVIVPRECVGDHDEAAHEQNLLDVNRRYADVIDAAASVAAIERWHANNDRDQ
jgi:maleamate amidohydrolase